MTKRTWTTDITDLFVFQKPGEPTKEWLPNILPYDYTSATGDPNGRKLTDDIVDSLNLVITKGKVTTDLLEPHTDYLANFPYLGQPH